MRFSFSVCSLSVVLLGACGSSEPGEPVIPIVTADDSTANLGCAGITTVSPAFTSGGGAIATSTASIQTIAQGNFHPSRITGEVAVRGTTAYTTTWGNSTTAGSALYVWDVSGQVPSLADSINISFATTLGDVAVSDDGAMLVVATERNNGSIVLFDLVNPRQPKLLSCFRNPETSAGVHTAEVGRVAGRLYAFLSIDNGTSRPAKLVIVDLADPKNPKQVFSKFIGNPYVHDTFVRDGLLFLALWNDGVTIWDIGGGSLGGSVSAPKEIGNLKTVHGEVHNIWWLKDPVTGSARYAFVGEEGPGSIPLSSIGDIHVVDVSTMSAPKEVAFYAVNGAGTHNFSVDEPNGILYAAYYNGGVRALDVRGDLGTCSDAQKSSPANSTLLLCDLRKMGREAGIGLLDRGNPVYVWGVQYLGGLVYASDMVNGIWKLRAVSRP
jgi:hypothetical protein